MVLYLDYYAIYTINRKPSSKTDLNEEVIYPLLSCYFVIVPHLMGRFVNAIAFCRKSEFCEYISSLYI